MIKIHDFSFDLVNKKDINKISQLRNQDLVRNAFVNKNFITFKEHYNYFDNLLKTNFFHYYVLRYKIKFIGVGYGKDYDKKNLVLEVCL
jgi:hypothetical protein